MFSTELASYWRGTTVDGLGVSSRSVSVLIQTKAHIHVHVIHTEVTSI